MKISINGDVIDTKGIYKITKVEKDEIYYKFDYLFYIKSFANSEILVTLDITKDCSRDETIQKLNKFRDSIIKIWSENQSDIPQFNL